MDDVLHIAEIPYEDGAIRFRYARILSADGTRWIRHGLFSAHHPNGCSRPRGRMLTVKNTGFGWIIIRIGRERALRKWQGDRPLGILG
jgi:hypothetical protein